MKIMHTVSSPHTKYGKTFCKHVLHGGTNFFEQTRRGMFHMGTNDQIIQGGEKLTLNTGLNLKNFFCTIFLWGWRFHVKHIFFSKKTLVLTCSLMPCGYFRFTYS